MKFFIPMAMAASFAALLNFMIVISSVKAEDYGTPDGYTPANESICDSVAGYTPSLYGLCVAFCEAQDHFDIEYPTTEDELGDYLAANKRAKSIYDNYQKRMKEGDPALPCIVYQPDECPCWTEGELDLYTNTNMVFRDLNFTTRISSRKGSFSVNGVNSFACRAAYYTDSGLIVVKQLEITPDEATVCKDSLRAQAVDLGL